MEEPGWTFVTTTNGTGHDNTVATPICDDGLHVLGEICDDGPSNFGSGDGCLDDCLGEHDGWYCSGGDETSPDVCNTLCGDNYIRDTEECEDGNTSNLDGCDASCMEEPGWTFSTTTNATGHDNTIASYICDDGLRVLGESCDNGPGNIGSGTGCLDDCLGSHDGWVCTGGSASTADTCSSQCGDNYIRDTEECEDGNTSNLDGCDASCMEEPGWTFSTTTNATGHDNTVATVICDDG